MSKIVVTGGAGFIGSHLAEHSVKKGYDVTVIDNLSRTNYNIKYLKKNYPKIEFVKAEISNLELIKPSFKDAEIVFHTAGQVAVTTSIEKPKLDFDTNVVGTFNVAEACRLSNTNPIVVYCSTNKVYGDLDLPVKELDKRYIYSDLNGVSESFEVSPETSNCPYGGSKICGENILSYYFHAYSLPTVRARMSCIYGTRQFGTEDQGWIAWFIIRSLLNKPITIYGNGKQVRDALYITDQSKAFFSLVENINKTKGKAFNIGGGPDNTLSLLELLDLIKEIHGSLPKISYSDWRLGDQKVYISDITKIGETTGWRPEVSVKEGVSNLISWLKENVNIFQ